MCVSIRVENDNILFFWPRDWSQESSMATTPFFCNVHFWYQVWRILLPYLQRCSLFSILPLFCFTPHDVITFLICIIQKHQYLQNEKKIYSNKKANLLYFENPFKYAATFFMSYALETPHYWTEEGQYGIYLIYIIKKQNMVMIIFTSILQ